MLIFNNIVFAYDDDYLELMLLDSHLVNVFCECVKWATDRNVIVEITHILRTWQENEAIYKEAGLPVFKDTPHLYGRAIDFILMDLNWKLKEQYYDDIVQFVDKIADKKINAVNHSILKNGRHIHLQTLGENYYVYPVLQFQRIAKMLEFYDKEVDGLWGVNTKLALYNYYEKYLEGKRDFKMNGKPKGDNTLDNDSAVITKINRFTS